MAAKTPRTRTDSDNVTSKTTRRRSVAATEPEGVDDSADRQVLRSASKTPKVGAEGMSTRVMMTRTSAAAIADSEEEVTPRQLIQKLLAVQETAQPVVRTRKRVSDVAMRPPLSSAVISRNKRRRSSGLELEAMMDKNTPRTIITRFLEQAPEETPVVRKAMNETSNRSMAHLSSLVDNEVEVSMLNYRSGRSNVSTVVSASGGRVRGKRGKLNIVLPQVSPATPAQAEQSREAPGSFRHSTPRKDRPPPSPHPSEDADDGDDAEESPALSPVQQRTSHPASQAHNTSANSTSKASPGRESGRNIFSDMLADPADSDGDHHDTPGKRSSASTQRLSRLRQNASNTEDVQTPSLPMLSHGRNDSTRSLSELNASTSSPTPSKSSSRSVRSSSRLNQKVTPSASGSNHKATPSSINEGTPSKSKENGSYAKLNESRSSSKSNQTPSKSNQTPSKLNQTPSKSNEKKSALKLNSKDTPVDSVGSPSIRASPRTSSTGKKVAAHRRLSQLSLEQTFSRAGSASPGSHSLISSAQKTSISSRSIVVRSSAEEIAQAEEEEGTEEDERTSLRRVSLKGRAEELKDAEKEGTEMNRVPETDEEEAGEKIETEEEMEEGEEEGELEGEGEAAEEDQESGEGSDNDMSMEYPPMLTSGLDRTGNRTANSTDMVHILVGNERDAETEDVPEQRDHDDDGDDRASMVQSDQASSGEDESSEEGGGLSPLRTPKVPQKNQTPTTPYARLGASRGRGSEKAARAQGPGTSGTQRRGPSSRGRGRRSSEGLPRSVIKQTFTHFCQLRVSKEAIEEVEKLSEQFFKSVAEDLEAYALHAHRKTINESDVELLMKRQRFITDNCSLNTLIAKYLPLEQRQELIPIARSGNRLEPKPRR